MKTARELLTTKNKNDNPKPTQPLSAKITISLPSEMKVLPYRYIFLSKLETQVYSTVGMPKYDRRFSARVKAEGHMFALDIWLDIIKFL